MTTKKKWGKKKDGGPNGHLVAVLDVDWPKYTVAAAGETRTIKVVHTKSGKEVLNVLEEKDEEGELVERKVPFKNRSAFWGRKKKVIEGWLGELNTSREAEGKSQFAKDDFTITDVQTPDPIENVCYSAKSVVDTALKNLGTSKYKAYIGKGASFRVGASTLMHYKGKRKDVIKPLLLDDISDYLQDKYQAQDVTGIETDDMVVIEAYGKDDHVVVGEDKDFRGQPVLYFDVNRPDEGVIDGKGLGELRVEQQKSDKKVLGRGLKFLAWQMITGDSVDCYKANCKSEVSWGGISGYNALVDLETEQEVVEKVIEVFKMLYPEPKEIETWRGNKITIDWHYVANEMLQMARMLRWQGDFINFDQWCSEYGVSY